MRDQIRRTEEEAMEMGMNAEVEIQEKDSMIGKMVDAATGLSSTGV